MLLFGKGTSGAFSFQIAVSDLSMDASLIDLKDLCGMATRDLQIINLREYTDWAEQQVLKGNDSENVLMLASLGLDRELDWYDVSSYFYAYLKEIGASIPDKDEADYYYVRRAFKMIAYANTDEALWSEVSKYFSGWCLSFYREPLNNAVSYWNSVHDDFIYHYIDDYPYFLNVRHSGIPEEKRAGYVRALAERFYRLFNSEYFTFFVRAPGKLMSLPD